MSTRSETLPSVALLTLALAACVWLVMRQADLRNDLDDARSRLEQERNAAAVATLNDIALPASAPLRLCNHTRDYAQVTALAGIYADPKGNLGIFNSARDGWRAWDVPSGAQASFAMRNSAWDGQALFYAIDVVTGGKHQLLSGTSRDFQQGCVNLFGQGQSGHSSH